MLLSCAASSTSPYCTVRCPSQSPAIHCCTILVQECITSMPQEVRIQIPSCLLRPKLCSKAVAHHMSRATRFRMQRAAVCTMQSGSLFASFPLRHAVSRMQHAAHLVHVPALLRREIGDGGRCPHRCSAIVEDGVESRLKRQRTLLSLSSRTLRRSWKVYLHIYVHVQRR